MYGLPASAIKAANPKVDFNQAEARSGDYHPPIALFIRPFAVSAQGASSAPGPSHAPAA